MSLMKVEEIGTKIRTERKKGGLTLEQLARKVGISAITLQRIETGKSSPSVIVLYQIANAVNRPMFSFFEEEANRSFTSNRRISGQCRAPI